MILIIGPAYSGKREYAAKLLSGKEKLPAGEIFPLREGDRMNLSADRDVMVTEVQKYVTQETDPDDLDALADSLCGRAVILTASETGAGIVPVDAAARRIREMQGRFLSILASRADSVVRVFYGIPEVLKCSFQADSDAGSRGSGK